MRISMINSTNSNRKQNNKAYMCLSNKSKSSPSFGISGAFLDKVLDMDLAATRKLVNELEIKMKDAINAPSINKENVEEIRQELVLSRKLLETREKNAKPKGFLERFFSDPPEALF